MFSNSCTTLFRPIYSLSCLQFILLLLSFLTLQLQTTKYGVKGERSLQNSGDGTLTIVSGIRFYHAECHKPITTDESACLFNGVGMGGDGGLSEPASVLEDVADRQAACASSIATKSSVPSFVLTLGDLTQEASLEQVSALKAYYLGRLDAAPCKNVLSLGRRDIIPPKNKSTNEESGTLNVDKDNAGRVELIKIVNRSILANSDDVQTIDWDGTTRSGSLSYILNLGSFSIYVLHDSAHNPKRTLAERSVKGIGTIMDVKQWLIKSLTDNQSKSPVVLVMHDWTDLKFVTDWDKQLSKAVFDNVVAVISTVPANWSKKQGTVQNTIWRVDGKDIDVYVAGGVDEDRVTKVDLFSTTKDVAVTYYDSSSAEDCVPA